jgi:hypothetical protein
MLFLFRVGQTRSIIFSPNKPCGLGSKTQHQAKPDLDTAADKGAR